jgi:Hydrolase of X-linked nucleoside diphosphate N terminal
MKNEQPKHWLEIAKRISSIAQTGLAFTNDKFDKERYFELQKLSIEILEHITEIETDKLEFIFNRDIGYQRPDIDDV